MSEKVVKMMECEDCYALVEYIGQPHNCPLDPLPDEGFEDDLEILLNEIKENLCKMAMKRKSSDCNQIAPKLIIGDDLELPEDIVLKEKSVNSQLKMMLQYDKVFEKFFVGFEKTVGNENKSIFLEFCEAKILQSIFDRIINIEQRYRGKGKRIAFSFELSKHLIAKLNNEYGNSAYLDIRKYIDMNGEQIPTKVGVRVNQDMSKMREVLSEFLAEAEAKLERTREVINIARAALIVKKIKELQASECEGCKLAHPSQEQHMGLKGCLQPWDDIVETFLLGAMDTPSFSDIIKLASNTSEILEETLFCPTEAEYDPTLRLQIFISDEVILNGNAIYSACTNLLN